jgi:hypothetical protein
MDPDAPSEPAEAIRQLHALFQSWFRGEGPADAMEQFERSLDPHFRMVTPSGAVLERDALLAHLSHSRAQRPPDHRVATRAEHGVTAGHLADGTPWVLMHYEEWVGSGEAQRGRQSSALLVADEHALAGWRWLHVHETWLPTPE